MIQSDDTGIMDQLWQIVDAGGGYVKIMNRNSNKVLGIINMSTSDGALALQWDDNGTADHLWQIVDAGGGYVKIVNKNSGLLLGILNMSTSDGAQALQWSDNGAADHLWKVTSQTAITVAPTSTAVAQTSTTVTQAANTGPTATPVASLSSPSGVGLPMGDLPGWHQMFAQDFNSNVPVGGFPGSLYGNTYTVYPDGTHDTQAQRTGGPSRYYPSKVLSVSNGVLNYSVHSENGTPMGAALLPILPGNHLYGKYTLRFRADAVPGFKIAWMLWPDSEVFPRDGEIDFPEGDLIGSIFAAIHHQDATVNNDQDIFNSSTGFTSWHTASIEWIPGKVTLLLDGSVFGVTTTRVPNTPMHWVLQTESCLNSSCSNPHYGSGNVQIDWMAAYSMA